ncbi:hypothetical protein LOD99_582 [Oopsacas minuta]|uniref:Mos1 transposase HTH domain-containing protein n=1 Tax=Oopsacas minuta TaxID=111878 RepID=A0AAV7KAJ7_9METZ|nr:hypothetical protein LOD99_582 [Oopsacas minuta]
MNLDKEHFRAYIFIEFRRGKSPSEIHDQLLETKLDESLSRATVLRWYQRFNEERFSLKDDPRVGRPRYSTNDVHIHQIRQLNEAKPKQSVGILADATEISRESVRRILDEVMGLRKVCSVWVPYLLSKANMGSRVVCAQEIVEMIDKYSMAKLLRCWATEDENWVFLILI